MEESGERMDSVFFRTVDFEAADFPGQDVSGNRCQTGHGEHADDGNTEGGNIRG